MSMKSKNSLLNKCREYAKLIRLQSLGVSTPPVVGALAITGQSLALNDFLVLFFIGLLSQVFGFVLNDFADIELDKTSHYLSERPLVKGTISKKEVYLILIVCFILGMGATALYFQNFSVMILLLIITILGSAYDLYGKRFVGSDFLVAGATAMLCLLGALAIRKDSQPLPLIAWIVIITAFIQMLYMNIIDGGMKDADHDYKAHTKTLAVVLGVKANGGLVISRSFKMLAICLRSISVMLLLIPFLINDPRFHLWQLILFVPLAFGTFYFSIKMLQLSTFQREKIGNLIRIQEILRYTLVPIVLMGYIGLGWTLLLIFLPFVWYAFSTWFIYGRLFGTPKTL